MTVKNRYGVEIDMNVAIELMDDDLRERLHNEGYDSEQEFFYAYCDAHEEKFEEEWELAKKNPVY